LQNTRVVKKQKQTKSHMASQGATYHVSPRTHLPCQAMLHVDRSYILPHWVSPIYYIVIYKTIYIII